MTPANAASWDIARRLVRGYPDLRIYETHPGGGTYDCLTLISPTVKIDINRLGSIHVHNSPGGEALPLIPAERWLERSQVTGGTQQLADEVLQFCQVPARKHAATAHGVTYRVIARVLTARQFDSHDWDARSQLLDTSGDVGGIRWPLPSPEMNQLPANQVWVILRDTQPITWLWDGWLWSSSGERLNIFGRHQRGESTADLAALATNRSIVTRAALPAVHMRNDQPIGSWPQQAGSTD